MRLNIPLDLIGHSFIHQLQWLEKWACLPDGTLSNEAKQLAAVANDGADQMVPVLLACVNFKPWHWSRYDEHIQASGLRYSKDLPTDMVEYVYDKYRANKMAIYRKSQLDAVINLRPYWEFSGRCASPDQDDDDALFVLSADDNYWETACVPWRCDKLSCDCRVDSLSEFEYRNL